MDAVTLQPAAGAHGEFTGILLIRALLESQGNPRKKILIPDSAHGTNPATATMAGYAVENIKSNERGMVDVEALARVGRRRRRRADGHQSQHAGRLRREHHAASPRSCTPRARMLYMDGANMNALVGIARPGDFGVDVMHLNLHKTFSTPHGGGGPGSGPVAVKKHLEPFLPMPRLKRAGKIAGPGITICRNPSAACAPSTATSACSCARWPTSWRTAATGCATPRWTRCSTPTTSASMLEPYFDLPYHAPTMHEVRVQRRAPGQARRAHRRHRQAPDRLRIPSLHRELPADRSRRDDDRADRDREQSTSWICSSTR